MINQKDFYKNAADFVNILIVRIEKDNFNKKEENLMNI